MITLMSGTAVVRGVCSLSWIAMRMRNFLARSASWTADRWAREWDSPGSEKGRRRHFLATSDLGSPAKRSIQMREAGK